MPQSPEVLWTDRPGAGPKMDQKLGSPCVEAIRINLDLISEKAQPSQPSPALPDAAGQLRRRELRASRWWYEGHYSSPTQ